MSDAIMMNLEEPMKGSYSYNNGNEYVFFVDEATTGHISPVDAVIARILFKQRMPPVKSETTPVGEQANSGYVPGPDIEVPADITLMNVSESQLVPRILNGFLITWTSNYELKRGTESILALHVQRQQGVHTNLRYLIVKP